VVPVIDLFAGPGGLSEGFERYRIGDKTVFKSVLSIEKERYAHQTLLLRAFFRQFRKPPLKYYEHLRGKVTLNQLYRAYPKQYKRAAKQAIRLALRFENRQRIDGLIRSALRGHRDSWVLIGGPPCQAYSMAGRARIRAEDGASFENDRRHFLYKEYLHILKTFKPPVFVMENVKGLLSSSTETGKKRPDRTKTGETFRRILRDFAAAGYSIHSFVKTSRDDQLRPVDYVINAEKYGIPQARHRVILLGVCNGVSRGSSLLRVTRSVSIQSAIGDLPRLRSRISPRSKDSFEAWATELRKLRSVFTRQGELRRMNGSRRALGPLPIGGTFIDTRYPSPTRSRWLQMNDGWFIDRKIKGVTLHQARWHMPTDLRRYLFASHYARMHGVSPKIPQFRWWQRPEHESIGDYVADVPFADRFRVQIRGKPSTTIVSHISKDGHYYIHYDPTQSRSLTVREAARLQTFPDNYYFEGSRTAQYQQVGNAVPPLLARKMAKIVHHILERL
jgi:DNA (cytosine-5)-methyltransferase 1